MSLNERPPGAFPTDDMAPGDAATIGHQRNKLHKSNDPRGHSHTDSGVGLHESNEPAMTKESVEDAYAPAEGYEQRREHAKRSGVAEFDDVKAEHHDTTEYEADPKDLGATAGTAAGARVNPIGDDEDDRNVVKSGTLRNNPGHKDPYWGDIQPGQGVYNTVSGHGSTSDETRRQHGTDESTDKRSFPLVTDRTRQHGYDDNTTSTDKHDAERTDKKDSRWKEGAAGAGAAGAAGTAAYMATRDKDDHSKDDRSKDTFAEETAEEKEKKGRGGLFGVFKRGSKDDKDDKHHKDKEEKKHAKEDKKHHHKDDKAAPVAAAGLASRDDKRQDDRYQDQNPSDNTRSGRTDPAVAAAAVAYSQHHDDNSSSAHRNEPASQGNDGQYNTLGSGTASGVRYGDSGPGSEYRDPLATGDRAHRNEPGAQSNQGNYNTLGSGTASGVRYGESGPGSDSREAEDSKDSKRNAAMYGTAGAAALGAGGYAAHEMRKDRDDKDDSLSKDKRDEAPRSGGWFTSPSTTSTTARHTSTDPAQSQRDTYTSADDPAKRSGNFVAAPVPSNLHQSQQSTRDPAADNYPSAAATGTSASAMRGLGNESSSGGVREPSVEIPRASQDANEGKYNVLSSGTPSGINMHDGQQQQPSATSKLPTIQDEKSNKGAMATAGLAAAGAGAGAATYASRRDNDQQKVTHKCVKCGEENDISQYFKDKTSRSGH